MHFGGDYSGWCCGSCDTLKAGNFWGVKAFPIIYNVGTPVKNPHVPILDARNNAQIGQLDPSYRWNHKLLKLKGNVADEATPSLVGGEDISSYRFSEFEAPILPRTQPQECVFHSQQSDWDYKQFNPAEENPNGNNNIRHHSPMRPIGVIAKRIDGEQVFANVISLAGTRSSPSAERYTYNDLLAFRYDPEYQLDIVDVQNETLVSNQDIIFSFGAARSLIETGDPYYLPIAGFNYGLYWAARRNMVISGNSIVLSTYCAYGGDMNKWGVARIPIAGQGGLPSSCKPGDQVSGLPNVVCGSYSADELSTDTTSRNYVITYDLQSTWQLGIWDNQTLLNPGPPPENEPQDPTHISYLEPSEIRSTITTGQLSPGNHVMLCYNRIGDRDMAIFYDWNPTTRPLDDPDTPPEPSDGYWEAGNIVGWREMACWIYDSGRASNPFFKHRRNFQWIYDNGDAEETEPGCVGFITERPALYISLYNFALPFSGDRIGNTYGPPTFITADPAGDIYIGSPQFISKYQNEAGEFGNDLWTIHAKEEYPVINRQSSVGCRADGGSGENVDFYLPFSSRAASITDTYDFGRIDYRNFSILPEGGNIQLRGFEGLIDMAKFPGGLEIANWESRYATYLPRSVASQARNMTHWITDWTITPDGNSRIPHLEPIKTDLGFADNAESLNPIEFIPDAASANSQPGPPFPEFLPTDEGRGYWEYRESNYWDDFYPLYDDDFGALYNEVVWNLGPRNYSDRPLADWISYEGFQIQGRFPPLILPIWSRGFFFERPSPSLSVSALSLAGWGAVDSLQRAANLLVWQDGLIQLGGADPSHRFSGTSVEVDATPAGGTIAADFNNGQINNYLSDAIWFFRDTADNFEYAFSPLRQAGMTCAWWDTAPG